MQCCPPSFLAAWFDHLSSEMVKALSTRVIPHFLESKLMYFTKNTVWEGNFLLVLVCGAKWSH
ncbi:hypothetical protein Krac_9324 [Ktedonobacter racemifer DSM 44963]|uniref:Uncharacterized protein n=1 Tax=Ktedonobacter racemifer DSM 44963 TaxID=485913 RepID=D6TBH7_KTERA|nr:hypothetical protein Krac_9324 [Ktedonobacter racemifer DSM 44963]